MSEHRLIADADTCSCGYGGGGMRLWAVKVPTPFGLQVQLVSPELRRAILEAHVESYAARA